MLDIDPKSRGRVPVREFTDRWKHLVDQMERFLVKLLKLLHRNGRQEIVEILDEASAKFSRVFHSKMYLPNLSVRLDAVRDQLMVDQQRVCHIRPTERDAVVFEYFAPAHLGVKVSLSITTAIQEILSKKFRLDRLTFYTTLGIGTIDEYGKNKYKTTHSEPGPFRICICSTSRKHFRSCSPLPTASSSLDLVSSTP